MGGGKSERQPGERTGGKRAILAVLGWLGKDMHATNPAAFSAMCDFERTRSMEGARAKAQERRLRVKIEAVVRVMDVAAERNLAMARAQDQARADDTKRCRRHERRKQSAKHAIESLTPAEVGQASRLLARAARTMAAERGQTPSVFDYLEIDVFEYLDEDSPDAQEQIRKLAHEMRKGEPPGAWEPVSLLELADVLEGPADAGPGLVPGAPSAPVSHEAS